MRVTERIQPALVVESHGIDDQRITIPPANRVSQPKRVRIGWRFAPVHIDLPMTSECFIHDDDQSRRLDNLLCREPSSA